MDNNFFLTLLKYLTGKVDKYMFFVFLNISSVDRSKQLLLFLLTIDTFTWRNYS